MASRRILPTRNSILEEEAAKPTVKSGTDGKLAANLLLRQRCAHFGDATDIIEKTVDTILQDKTNVISSKTKRGIKDLKDTVLPMMKNAVANEMLTAIKKLAPIPAVNYVHQTKEAEERRKASHSKKKNQTTPMKRIADVLRAQNQEEAAPKQPRVIVSPIAAVAGIVPEAIELLPPRRVKPPRRVPSEQQSEVRLPRAPPPEDGAHYTAIECVTYLKPLGPKIRGRMIKRWVETKQVRASATAIYSRLKDDAMGKPIKDFGKRGRNPLLSPKQIDNIADYLSARHGKAFSLEDVKAAMKEEEKLKIQQEGCVPLQTTSPSKRTVINYKSRIADHPKVSIAHNAIPKTTTRITAENSLISAMALAVAVAASHWNPCLEPQQAVERDLEQRATEGAKKLYNMLKKFYGPGVHLRPISPAFILSTDDTVQYVFEGEGRVKDQFVLVGASSNRGKHTRSVFVPNNTKAMSGLRVKLTYTFTATGLQAPVFVTVSGLTDAELPVATCQSGILHLDIEGLSVGGGGVQLSGAGKGSLVFIRNDLDQDKDKKRVRYYRDHVLFPFIDGIRTMFSSWEPGMKITDDIQVQSWCDGDISQLASIVDAESIHLYAEKGIRAIKQNAARTGTEQAADLCSVFPSMTALHDKVTLSNIDTDLHPLKMALTREFDKLTREGVLNLPSNKRNALINFLALLPETMQQACTRRGIIHGFQENGMVDKYKENGKIVSSRYPDFDKMLGTCRTNPSQEEYDLCISSFPILLEYFIEHGHIPDDQFEDLGFMPDIDLEGREIRREAGIECESRQRVKDLTHKYQVQLRQERLAAIAAEAARKMADTRKRKETLLALNKKCEAILEEDGGHLVNGSLSDLVHNKFRDLTTELCKAFLSVRDPALQVSKLPKKGKRDDVATGPPNLVRMVHEYRNKPVVVRASSDEEISETVVSPDNQPAERVLEQATVVPVMMRANTYECLEKASKILDSVEWIEAVKKTLVSEGQELADVDDQMKSTADVLQKQTLQRLTSHVRRRVPEISGKKRGCEWVFRLQAKNAARLAALMCLQGHVKSDLACLGEDKTLLAGERNFMTAMDRINREREGAYLYFDSNDSIHIRSGKIAGRPFWERHDEHKKAAGKGGRLFYQRYPSRALTGTEATRKGYFENLQHLVAVGFDSSSPTVNEGLSKILLFDDDVRKRMSALKFGSDANLLTYNEKKRHMSSYLFELAYDLAISITDNVSTSPGFETCGLFGS